MRITAGQWRGRKIPVLDSRETALRPSSDKIRQAIMNILAHNPDCLATLPPMNEVLVLDAFCGSGALGLEVLSRGANKAIFWDNNPKAIKALQSFLNQHDIANVDCVVMDALKPKPRQGAAVHLVFLDPPYGRDMIDPALENLQKSGWIDQQTLCVCEAERDFKGVTLDVLVQKNYGNTQLMIGHYKVK